MIVSFACKETEKVFHGRTSRHLPPEIQTRARRKLVQLDNAQGISDMRVPPSNRLEPLSGQMTGQWSVRINQQWRLAFRWADGNAFDVQIMDYH